MRVGVVSIGLCGVAVAAIVAGHRGAAADGNDDVFRRDVAPFLARWCFECHSGETVENDLDLSKLGAGGDPDVLREIRTKLRRREMPPKEAPQPPAADVARIVAWIDSLPDDAGASDPGRVTIRRLSRTEYRNTVRDLCGVDFDAEARLPPDDVGLGFDNIGDVLTLPPVLFEKYLAAAEFVASRAIVAEDPARPPVRRFDRDSLQSSRGARRDKTGVAMFSPGEAFGEMTFPRDGEYLLRVRAFAQQAGPEPARIALRVPGASDQVVDVTAVAKSPEIYEVRARVAAGRRRVAAAFINDYYKPDDPDPTQRDRNLFVQWIEVAGPVDVRPVGEFQRELLGDDSKRPRDRAFAIEVARRIANRAYRRPATADEASRLADLVAEAQKSGASFERGVEAALTAALVSPSFLFRVETDPSPGDPNAAHDLTEFELATRLSYFLWSSMPDRELSSLAAKGALHDPDVLAAQTRRMLRDARASALVTNFAVQWLELRRLDDVAPDPARFPEFDDALRASMRQETEMFVEAVVREGRPLRDFLDADFTFVDARLAKHYGLAGVKGDRFERVPLPRGRRGGLVTQASILTLTSNPTRTSPVKRGKFILEEILAEPPPPPPPGVGALDESAAATKAASLKERLARHRSDPNCASCHTRMDALGFALENFDPVGAWRERDESGPVDAVGTLPDGRAIDGPAQLRAVLTADDAFARCLAEKLLVYALGRAPTRDDRRALDRLVKSLPGLDATFEDVVLGIVRMDGFRRRRGEGK